MMTKVVLLNTFNTFQVNEILEISILVSNHMISKLGTNKYTIMTIQSSFTTLIEFDVLLNFSKKLRESTSTVRFVKSIRNFE